MYEGHFQLERRPFAATPDPGCCYLSPTQTPLFQTVGRCIENGQGIAILTGPAGIGKTLLAQVLLANAADRFTTVYLGTGQFPTRRALLQAILYELGQPYGGMTDQELRLELNTALRNLITQRDGLLLILDEAHLLSDRLLEEIRLLADLAQHGVPLMRVVLSGNPEFEERLTASSLAAFNQRVACHVALETLTQQESISYLEYRVQWAGGNVASLFEYEALKLIAYASDGVPRCLNQLADHSLMQAYMAGVSVVTAAIVRQALADVQQLPLRWNPSALHERISRPAAAESSTEVMGAGRPASRRVTDDSVADHAEVIEVGASEETSCFEFGAGDGPSPAFSAKPTATHSEPHPVADVAHAESAFAVESVPHSSDSHSSVFEFGAETDNESESIDSEMTAADEEDDDGPPLFAWLAKPAKTEPSAPAPRSDFSTSSFSTPTRLRSRAAAVEHEVVSTAPLTGSELGSKRLAEPVRLASMNRPRPVISAQALPAEEVVIDGYARLDAPLTPMFPRPAPTLPIPSIVTSMPLRADSAIEAEAEISEWSGGTATATLDHSDELSEQISLPETVRHAVRNDLMNQPLKRIDAIYALIEDESEDLRSGGTGVELITDYGVERIDVDLPSNAKLPSGVSTEHHLPIDLENWIGSTVVEVGRDLQQNMATSFPELVDRQRAKKLDRMLEGIERASRYDVVEPAAAASSNRIDPPADVAQMSETGAVPAPNHNYKNFFSMLRRRQSR